MIYATSLPILNLTITWIEKGAPNDSTSCFTISMNWLLGIKTQEESECPLYFTCKLREVASEARAATVALGAWVKQY